MHFVKRGSEPAGLKKVREKFTPRWVKYYKDKIGKKPADSNWRKFHINIDGIFFSLCAYCETICKGEVEHFQPKSKYPTLVYLWSNWLLSCHDCNHAKREQWPKDGYINPCARKKIEHPEKIFDFDIDTGFIIPKKSLNSSQYNKAVSTINDLKLNALFHLRRRLVWIYFLNNYFSNNPFSDPNNGVFIKKIASRKSQYSSITRRFLKDRGHPI